MTILDRMRPEHSALDPEWSATTLETILAPNHREAISQGGARGRRVIVGAVAAAIVGASAGGIVYANSAEPDDTKSHHDILMPDGTRMDELSKTWPKNEFGLTYGWVTHADVKARNIPDLVPFQSVDGRTGFLRGADLYPAPAATEAARDAQTQARFNDKGEEIHNLYGPDGVTVLGTEVISTAG